MTGFPILLAKELREQARTMRLVVVAGFFLAFGLLSPIIAKYLPEIIAAVGGDQLGGLELPTPTTADAVAQFVKNVGGTAGLAAILLAMGMVAGEKERGTAAFILTRPAGRAAFILAKAVALATTLGISVAAAGGAAYAYTALLFETPSPLGWLAMCVLVWLGLLVLGAMTLLGSTLVRSTALAAGIGLVAYVALSIGGALPTVGAFTPSGLDEPALALAVGETATDLVRPVVGNLVLTVAPVVAAWWSFSRQEL